jgi:hypothetical protein
VPKLNAPVGSPLYMGLIISQQNKNDLTVLVKNSSEFLKQ